MNQRGKQWPPDRDQDDPAPNLPAGWYLDDTDRHLEHLAAIAPVVDLLDRDAPAFGSDAWCALEPHSPRWWASVAAAALHSWNLDTPLWDLEIRQRTADHIAASREVCASLTAAGHWDWTVAPHSAADLQQARRHQPRPDRPDYRGGPIPPWGPTGAAS